VHPLRALVAEQESWLVRRVLAYARERGYTRYTSTLEEAWRASIAGLSAPLMDLLDRDGSPPELSPDDGSASDPLSAFGVLEARRHRERGVTLPMFLGLMKYYRQSYIDLVRVAGFPRGDEEAYLRIVARFFDRVEVAFCSEWERASGEERVAELSAVNRAMTNEKNKYLTLFESLASPVVLLDREGRVDNANHAAAGLLGGSETPGTRYYAAERKGEALPFLAEEVSAFLAAGAPSRSFEATLGTPRGVRHYRVEMHRMLDVSGKFDGAVVTFNDLTRRLEAEETLQVVLDEMEARVEERTGELGVANQALRRANRALRMTWECGRALMRARDESALLSEICRIAVEEGGYRLAWVGYAEDDPGKTVRPVAQAGYEEGYLDNVAISWADTERGRGPVGTAVRTGGAFVVRDVHSDPLFAPWQAEAVRRGYQSVLGLPLFSGDRPFGAVAIYSEEADAFDDDEVRLLQELANDLAQGIRTLRLAAERDRLEERRSTLEAQLRRSQRMESVGRLAGGVAHNLNNLLTVINGYCTLLGEGIPEAAPERRMLAEMRHAGERAAELTEQLLAFGRRQMLQPRDVEVDLLVGEVGPALRAACGGNVELSMRAAAAGAAIRVDTEGFRHMVTRLAASACEGMQEVGSLSLHTSVAELASSDAPGDIGLPQGEYVVLTLRDTGPGMDEESLSRIFDPFHRSLVIGPGLELASVYGFVKQSGGYIWATSAPGKGTTFTVCLPRVRTRR
jgi:signal transduction histidine kinase/PAS domain-containing protein